MSSFYWPMFIYGPILALRSRSIAFFSAANPGLYLSGLGMESKFATIQKIPMPYRPKSILVRTEDNWETIQQQLEDADIHFPVIAKPDVGFRGLLVRKITQPAELQTYLKKYPFPFLVQEFLPHPTEVGVLYYRYPNQQKGIISSLTLKEFLHVEGDGYSTVQALVEKKPRAKLQMERLRTNHADLLQTIPPAGQRISLGVIGNHSKGTAFINGNHLIDEELIAIFDRIARQIEGFHFGRFDIKCESLESLKKRGPLKVIELNGICSEPTHIYDPSRSTYFGALRDVMKHWSIIRRVSYANHRQGVPYENPVNILKAVMRLFAYQKKIVKISSYDEAIT